MTHPGNGAGFEQLALAARMGIAAERLDTDENGSVEQNAADIAAELRRLRSMATAPRRARLAGLTLPRGLLAVNYVPLPLSGDLTEPARTGYRSLRDLGPNDGLALTVDEMLPGAVTIVEAGLDHFMTAPDIDPWPDPGAHLREIRRVLRADGPSSSAAILAPFWTSLVQVWP